MFRHPSQSPSSARKRSPARKHGAATLSANVDKKLLGYAAAAAAALVAGSTNASAELIYTPANVVIGPNSEYLFDIDGDGTADLKFVNNADLPRFASLSVQRFGPGDGSVVVAHFTQAVALYAGSSIGTRRQFNGYVTSFSGGPGMAFYVYGNVSGYWANATKRYLGFRFRINNEFHYGWARLNVRVDGKNITARLTGYAYETVANKRIRAGQRTEIEADESPKPQASLGILAAGSMGILLDSR